MTSDQPLRAARHRKTVELLPGQRGLATLLIRSAGHSVVAQNGGVEVRRAAQPGEWADVEGLLFAYQQETAVEVGAAKPARPEDVWLPVRQETTDPASVHSTFLVAYDAGRPVGGVALLAGDASSVLLRRCFVLPQHRRRGVATALVAEAMSMADERGVARLALDCLPSRTGAIAAWRSLGFVDAEPWGDPAMVYLESAVGDGEPRSWLGLDPGRVVLCAHDDRWVRVFEHHAEVLRRALGDHALAIEHIGSTAVPGLAAAPIIDIALRLAPAVDMPDVVEALVTSGYGFAGAEGDGALLLVATDRHHRRLAHVHVVGHPGTRWERDLAVRDRLRVDPGARLRYGKAKRDLVERFGSDHRAYAATKASALAEVLNPDVAPPI